MELSDYIDLQECPLLQVKFQRILDWEEQDVDAVGISRKAGMLIVHCLCLITGDVAFIPVAFDQFAEAYELITM